MLDFLGDYVVTHFSAEENIQLHYSYPNYKLHKAMHEGFISDVEKLKKKFEAEGATLTMVLETNRVFVAPDRPAEEQGQREDAELHQVGELIEPRRARP